MKYTLCITLSILIIFGASVFPNIGLAQFESPVDFPLYVGDVGTKIAVIDVDGNITKRMPPNPKLLGAPAGIAFDGNGTLYVAETLANQISEIDVNTGAKTIIASGGLFTPSGLAFDSTGKLYVSEVGNDLGAGEISVVDVDTGEVNLVADGLDFPLGIAFDNDGILYVAESLTGKISRIDPRGENEFPLDVSTVVVGLWGPHGIAFGNDGLLYVSEIGDDIESPGRVSTIDLETQTITHLEINPPPDFPLFTPNKIAFHSDGLLYLSTPISIWRVDLSADPLEAEAFAASLAGPTYPTFTGQLDASIPKPAPVIAKVNPGKGPTVGGTVVTITGENFLPKAQVFFGDNRAEVISMDNPGDAPMIAYKSFTEIRVLSPPGDKGPKNVKVINWDEQEDISVGGFTYTSSLLGDVSDDGTISAYDASLILQFVVGLIEKFPAQMGASPMDITPRNRTVSVANLSVIPGERVRVPIMIDDASGLVSGGIVLAYDADMLNIVEVTPSGMMSGYYWQYRVQDNQIRIAFAGVNSLVGEGSLFYLECEGNAQTAGKQSPIILEKVQLGNSLNIAKIHGVVAFIPAQTALLPNYPNPFNPETWIPYELASDSPVMIGIYDAKGQMIRTITLGEKRAGAYVSKDQAAYWNGRDSSGEKVASGIYYYTLEAGEFRATRKMVILK